VTTGLPLDSARLAWFVSAWLRGDVAPDDVLDAVVGDDAAHDVSGLDGQDSLPLVLALGRIRASGAESAGLALPWPGLPAGLGGPAAFNSEAIDAGEAVVLSGAGLGLVPHRAGAGVVWRCLPANRRQLLDLGEADRALRSSMAQTATALAMLDVARWRPEVADDLMNLRHRPAYAAPPGTPPRAIELAGRAVQALGIVDLALEDTGGARTAHEIDERERTLRPLGEAARAALVAACSPECWPPA
jgi:hypothetical protein